MFFIKVKKYTKFNKRAKIWIFNSFYWIITFAPADSNCFFASSASCFDIDSFKALGSEFVSSFDSFRPNEVNSLIILNTVNLLERWSSDGTSLSIKSKVEDSLDSVLSSDIFFSIGTVKAWFVVWIGIEEVWTPKVSSICLTSSAASNSVIDFNFSIISVIF